MEPEKYKFGGGSTETVLHPVVLAVLLVVVIVLVLLPRRYMIWAFLCGAFLIPAGQQVLLGTVHVFAYRIIVLAGLVRMLRSRQTPVLAGKWNEIDTAFACSIAAHGVAFTLLYSEVGAVINQVGFVWDYLGGYVVLRYGIRSEEDVVKAIKCCAVLAGIFAVSMIGEQVTSLNAFGFLGGVRLVSEVRGQRIRSEAVFQHAILAGTFGAIMLPLFILLWKTTRSTVLAVIGGISSVVMMVTCACSTPLFSGAAVVVGVCAWPVRKWMRWVRWGLAIGLGALSLVMSAPVWYLIARVGAVQGSSGYHRAVLLDTFIRHVGDWWLLGTDSNGVWGELTFDTANQYVSLGVTGGITCLVFFILTIVRAFGRIGKRRRAIARRDRRSEWYLWLLGVGLLANVVAFWGISYFDQTRVAWLALLAMIAAATVDTRRNGTGSEGKEHRGARPPLQRDSGIIYQCTG